MEDEPTAVRFREVQRIHQWWIWLVVLAAAGLLWWAFAQQIVFGEPWGDRPGPDLLLWVFFVLVGVVMPAMIVLMRLETVVGAEAVWVRWWPFPARRIPLASVSSCEALTYRPILHYGGWGIRWNPVRGWCFNASGDRGVVLRFPEGKPFLIGSRNAEALAAAIEEARATASG